MLKKVAVVGLAILLVGAAVLGWTLAGIKREQQETAFYKLKYGSELKECLRQYDEWLKLPPEEQACLPFGVGKNWKARTESQRLQDQQGRLKADLDRLAAGEKDTYPFANILYGENWQEELRSYKSRKERNEFVLTASIVCTCRRSDFCLVLVTVDSVPYCQGLVRFVEVFCRNFCSSRRNQRQNAYRSRSG